MSLQEQYTTKKEQVNKNITELDASDSKKYQMKVIQDSVVYPNKAENYLLEL